MKYQQVLLKSGDTSQVVFIETGLKKGFYITLKDSDQPQRRWKIVEMYEVMNEKDIKDSHSSENWYKKDWLYKMTPKSK